jgi:4-oxalocrotonate tautomerase
MPLVRIDLRRGKPAAYKKAICDSVYRAMMDTFGVPKDDRFMIVNEHDADNFIHADNYLGIAYSNDLILIQVTANDTRTLDQKKAFFARVAALLSDQPGMRKEDIFINLVEVKKENWSFGNGIAQYA